MFSIRLGTWYTARKSPKQVIVEYLFTISSKFGQRESLPRLNFNEIKLFPRNHQKFWFLNLTIHPMVDVCFGNGRPWMDVHTLVDVFRGRFCKTDSSSITTTRSSITIFIIISVNKWLYRITVINGILDPNVNE